MAVQSDARPVAGSGARSDPKSGGTSAFTKILLGLLGTGALTAIAKGASDGKLVQPGGKPLNWGQGAAGALTGAWGSIYNDKLMKRQDELSQRIPPGSIPQLLGMGVDPAAIERLTGVQGVGDIELTEPDVGPDVDMIETAMKLISGGADPSRVLSLTGIDMSGSGYSGQKENPQRLTASGAKLLVEMGADPMSVATAMGYNVPEGTTLSAPSGEQAQGRAGIDFLNDLRGDEKNILLSSPEFSPDMSYSDAHKLYISGTSGADSKKWKEAFFKGEMGNRLRSRGYTMETPTETLQEALASEYDMDEIFSLAGRIEDASVLSQDKSRQGAYDAILDMLFRRIRDDERIGPEFIESYKARSGGDGGK